MSNLDLSTEEIDAILYSLCGDCKKEKICNAVGHCVKE